MLAAICFSGCLKIIDWVPVTFEIMVQDEQGNDLLDPENDNTWLLGTTVWFRGIEVELEKKGISEPVTKDYGIKYEGFRLEATILHSVSLKEPPIITMNISSSAGLITH